MPASSRSMRVLIYSHDSFGLGHVSRCRTIANALVEADESVSVLILSGSPMIGSYEFHSGIDFVRVPGVVKQLSGDYDSANLRVGVEHTMEMRTRIIRDTADIFRPDLFIVDKEPLGLRGEVGPALRLLKERGTPLVLGLRDVMDDPAALAQEWERKKIVPALRSAARVARAQARQMSSLDCSTWSGAGFHIRMGCVAAAAKRPFASKIPARALPVPTSIPR